MMTNENIGEFWKFIDTHRYKKGNDMTMTHTTLGYPKGVFSIEASDYEKFMELYAQIVKMNNANKRTQQINLHFVERPNPVTYLFVDFDFNHKQRTRQYSSDTINHIVNNINQIIRQIFKVNDKQLLAMITEKPQPTFKEKEKLYKDGPHVYYPYITMSAPQRYYILDTLTKKFEEDHILDDIPYVNDMDDIVDTSIVENNGILMIGSAKEGCAPYQLTTVLNHRLEKQPIDEYDIEDIVYLLSNRRHDDIPTIELLDNDDYRNNTNEISKVYAKYNKNARKNIAQNNYSDDRMIRGGTKEKKDDDDDDGDDNNDELISMCEKKSFDGKNQNLSIAQLKDIELAKKLISIMSVKRATDYTTWKRVCFALYSVSHTLFPTFIAFSKKAMRKYRENKIPCESMWNTAEEYSKYYSIASLRHWARLDDTTGYFKVIREMTDDLFGKAETSRHVDIANLVYELYKDRFVCIDLVKNKWYEFQNHRWVVVQSAHSLAHLISTEVRVMMTMHCSEKLAELAQRENIDRDLLTKRYQKLLMTIEKLADIPFRKNVLEACANYFYDPEFQKKLDQNTYLVGFNNGVYDLKEHSFRDGLPSDGLSKSVNYNYKDFVESDKVFIKIAKYFSQVHTDEDMREYTFTFIASILRGVPDSKVHIWTGGGGNGKSATVDLIKHMLGDYFGVLPVTFLTRKKMSSSNATPELADKFGKRMLVIQEPEHNDVVYVGQMKEISGKDTIQARPLYGDPFEYVPQFALVLTCNVLPHIPSSDRGTWRRLRVTPYESEFVESNPQGLKQFLIDEELSEEFEHWAQPLMWLVLNRYYPIYEKGVDGKKFRIAEPAKVKQFTNAYKMDSDIYMEFLEDGLIITKDEKDSENIGMVFDAFKSWYSTSYSEKAPPKKEFMNYLKKNKYTVDKQNIYGVKYAFNMM